RVIQFIIPWSVLITPIAAQLNAVNSENNMVGAYPVDHTFYNHFLNNQAQLNNAILMQNQLLQANTNLAAHQTFHTFPQQNLPGLNPKTVGIFNPALQTYNQLPPQPFFDPLAIQPPITDLNGAVVNPAFASVPQRPSESYLGGIPSPSLPQRPSESYLGGIPSPSLPVPPQRNSRALTVKSFETIEKPIGAPTDSTTVETKVPEESEQVKLIRKLLEETLAEQRRVEQTTPVTSTTTETTTSTTSTTQAPITTQKTEEKSSSIASVAQFGLLDRLNLNETEKKAIVARVEELLRAEIARKLLSEVSPPPPPPPPPPHHIAITTEQPTTTTSESTTTIPSTTTTEATTTSTTQTPTTETTTTATTPLPTTTTTLRIKTTTTAQTEVFAVPHLTIPTLFTEKTELKSLALKQKKVGGRSIVRPVVAISESIDEPTVRLRVSSVEKEIREAQPRLPSRYIHNQKKDFDEDLDLIDQSGRSESRPDTEAAASLLTSARRIAFPQDYDELPPATPAYRMDFFQPATGAPLDLSGDLYEDEDDGGLVQLDFNQRRREQLKAIATPSPFNIRTTSSRPFHDEPTRETSTLTPDPVPVNLETVTTPPYRNGRQGHHRATKFELLASDYRSRLGEAGDLGHILKRLSQNAYIALIETDGGSRRKRLRHESRTRGISR
ncbi:hypothetical protein PFISCL1PPCAC_10298, partial [Pristionchus fissidentatus]